MKPIEFPNNANYYLALAEEAFSEGNQQQALENYKQAYQLDPSAKLNRLIASLAIEQGDFSGAATYAEEAADSYLETLENMELYLQIQLYGQRFFTAREFLWRAQKVKLLTEEQKNRWEMRIADQEAFYQKQQQAQINQLETELAMLPLLEPMEQLVLVRKIRELPANQLRARAEKLMVDPNVAPLVRSYLFESLAQLGFNEKVRYLTIQAEIIELSPASAGFDDRLLLAIEEALTLRLRDQDPILLSNLLEQVKVELAFLYPLQSSFMDPEAWTASYLAEYLDIPEPLNDKIETIREKIKQLMFAYH
ncbi:hypothetical protein P7H00_06300 [Enterococcus pseudoavium]|uniref:Tetratricopeptide repeat protein n=1 Tax=Enterococcus pseudoavium TaxID=44007 RepID=A0AAE4HZM8_9ENTE|nr:hypothetical protein [Enterococcus pseudoavium]MDT2736749.1 hypothetical protein [Enterococcus pseudoavium]